MSNITQSPKSHEDNDANNTELHDALEAGKKAIAAEQLVNEKNKGEGEKEDVEKADAENWRNEG